MRGVVLGLVPGETIPELAQPSPQRAAGLGKPLRAEDQQGDDQDEQQVSRGEQVSDHDPPERSGCSPAARRDDGESPASALGAEAVHIPAKAPSATEPPELPYFSS